MKLTIDWKDPEELTPGHPGFVWLKTNEGVFVGWKGGYGYYLQEYGQTIDRSVDSILAWAPIIRIAPKEAKSPWKPIAELVPRHEGVVSLKNGDDIFTGWKGMTGAMYRCPSDPTLDDIVDAQLMEGDTSKLLWMPIKQKDGDAKPKKKSKWVRVEDRKPEEEQNVLAYGGGIIYDAEYRPGKDPRGDFYVMLSGNHYAPATHWRPLPKGPKGETHE